MRPITPIPNGCSMTLLSCHINLASNQQQQQEMQTFRPEKKYSIYHKKNEGLIRQKQSLRNRNSKNIFRQSLGVSARSNISQQSQLKYDRFSQVSSVVGPQFTNKDYTQLERTEGFFKVTPSHENHLGQRGRTQSSNIFGQINQNKTSIIYNQNVDNIHVFPDQITLNMKPVTQLKERETAHTNNISQRRVLTEQNKKQIVTFVSAQRSSMISNHVYKSEMINSQSYNYPDKPFPNHTTSIFPHDQNAIRSDLITPCATNSSGRNPAIKKPTPFQGKTSMNTNMEQRISESAKASFPANKEVRLDLMQTQAGLAGSEIAHVRKISSPRFPKKFNTLIDLNCKNVDSSGGDHTSSNHVSIVTSQASQNYSIRHSNGEQFAKVIKLMTLKSLPLNQGLWSNLQKNSR